MARPRWQRLTKQAVKSAVTLLVLWAVGRHVLRTWNDLRDHRRSFHFEPGWLIGAGLLYLAGLLACGRFFELILRSQPDAGQAVAGIASLRGEPPGKVRSGQSDGGGRPRRHGGPVRARASTAAIATFYETLVMMASGGLIAAAGFATGSRRAGDRVACDQAQLPFWGSVSLPLYRLAAWGGLGLGLVFLFLLTVPPVFSRLAGLVSLPIPGVGPEAMPRFTGRLWSRVFSWSSCGWVLLGLSQLAVVRAFDPAGTEALIALGLVPVVIASVALATVAGFVVAVLPGGLGVREGVLMSALAPAIGSDQAVIASLIVAAGLGGGRAGGRRDPLPLVSTSASRCETSPADRPRARMISVVVPVHDEEESLAALHGELAAVFADGAVGPVEFIFVDDGSRDGSWAVLTALARRDPRVSMRSVFGATSARRPPSWPGSRSPGAT